MAPLVEYRLRIRNAADSADALVVSSVRGDALPWLAGVPEGDGAEFDPLTGRSRAGTFRVPVIDAITAGTNRVVTSLLEDATLRQQLVDRVAIIERRLGGGAWVVMMHGVVSGITLAGALVYEIRVSDLALSARRQQAFAPRPDPTPSDPGRLESITSYLTRWPQRGCVLGGPVRGDLPDIRVTDLTGWRMKVSARSAARVAWLELVEGYGPPTFTRMTTPEPLAGPVNKAAGKPGQVDNVFRDGAISTVDEAAISHWPNLVLELTDAAGVVHYFRPIPGLSFERDTEELMRGTGKHQGLFVYDPTAILAVGTALRVRAWDAIPSQRSPLYWSGHPVDLLTTLWSEAGIPYSAAAATTAKAALGTQRRITLRITGPTEMQGFIEKTLLGPFGLAARTNAAGELEVFTTRVTGSAAPTRTITAADTPAGARGELSGETFAIDAGTAIRRVIWEHQRLTAIQARMRDYWSGDASQALPADQVPTDGVLVGEERIERGNGDPDALGSAEVTYTLPGMVHLDDQPAPDVRGFVDVVAHEIFDRWGRGIITGEVELLEGGAGDGLVLGEELLNALPHLPNHNKRLQDDPSVAARAMQAVRITPTSRGLTAKLLDSGPNAQPVATLPVLAIAASADAPRTTAEVTITNAAALNAAAIGVRIQMATSTGAAPAAAAFADAVVFPPGEVPTTAFALPAITAGRTVWAKGRSEQPDMRPSNYSVPVSVALTGIAAPSGVSVTPDVTDGSLATVAWTVGAADLEVDVFLRLATEAAALAVRRAVLPAGSTRYVLDGLTPGVNYIAGVAHRDVATGDKTAPVEVPFAAGATTAALSAPAFEQGFSGVDPLGTAAAMGGLYGIAVVAMERPGFVEIAEAVETAPGSGAFGAFTTVGKVPSMPGGVWTIWQALGANDGKKRRLKARHIWEGRTASPYTATVDVLPWTVSVLGSYPTQGYVRITTLDPLAGEGPLYVRAQVEWIDPMGTAGEVRLVDHTSNTARISGTVAGTWQASPGTWKMYRPNSGNGTGEARFGGRGDSGTDEGVLTLPEQGSDAPILTVTARIVTNSTSTPVYRVFVSHNHPTATPVVTLTGAAVGVGLSADAGPFGVAPGSSTYVDYTITIPTVGNPQGRVVWTAVATNFVSGKDVANFGDIGVDFTTPTLSVTVTTGSTSYSVAYVTDGAISYYVDGVLQTTPSSPFTISRNGPGGQAKVIELRATNTATGEIARFPFTVPAQESGPTVKLSALSAWQDSPSAGYMQVFFVVTDAPSGATYNCFYDIEGGDLDTEVGVTSGSSWPVFSFGTGVAKVQVQAYDSGGNAIGAPIAVWRALSI